MAVLRKSKRVIWPSTKQRNAIIPKSTAHLDVAPTHQGMNLILSSDHTKASDEITNDLRTIRILAVHTYTYILYLDKVRFKAQSFWGRVKLSSY